MGERTAEQVAHIAAEYRTYMALAIRVPAMRSRLEQGDLPADVLADEFDEVVASAMTREQVAAGLVSLLMLAAQGHDLRTGPDLLALVGLGALDVPVVPADAVPFPYGSEPSGPGGGR
jgi:hypothetical protein